MSAAERLAAVKSQLEALKGRIRQLQREKEEQIDWEVRIVDWSTLQRGAKPSGASYDSL